MDTRRAYIRRSRKGSRLNRRLAVVGALGVAACASLFAFELGETATAAAQPAPAGAATPLPGVSRTAAPVQADAAPARRVYPHSIVPGGVRDSRELARVIATDKVVAAHYAGFGPAQFSVKTVDSPRAVYVSYRKGDKVYWTSKKLQLAKGETVLSDGTNEIRTRCGNRISDVRMLPVEANGPSEEELDSFVEQADGGDDDGSIEEASFDADSNPAGQGYALQTFDDGGGVTLAGGTQSRGASSLGWRGNGVDGFGGGATGGLPLYLTENTRQDAPATHGGAGASGASGASGSGTGAGTGTGSGKTETAAVGPTEATGGKRPGTAPPATSTDTRAPSIPDALTPPTSDEPGKPATPGAAPAKATDVPEPGTLWLSAVGMVALLGTRRRTRQN